MSKRKFTINRMSNKDNIIKKVLSQISQINEKIKEFEKYNIDEQKDFLNGATNNKIKYTKSGRVSTSKKWLNELNVLQLKSLYTGIHNTNTHDIYGTVRRFEKVMTESAERVRSYVVEHLQEKGYDDKFINEVINQKGFYDTVFYEFNNMSKGYGSDGVIEKVALQYANGTIDKKEVKKKLNTLERNRNIVENILEDKKDYNEYIKNRNKKKR